MVFSNHAQTRKQQRSFSNEITDVIQIYGRSNKAPGGAAKLYLGKKEGLKAISDLKRKIKLIERAIGGTIILSEEYKVITVYKTNICKIKI